MSDLRKDQLVGLVTHEMLSGIVAGIVSHYKKLIGDIPQPKVKLATEKDIDDMFANE